MSLSEGELGLSLVGAPIGVQLSLLVANHVVARFSLAKVMITGLAVIMAVYVATAVAGSTALFFALLFVMGLSVGILEVAVNLEADRVEYGLKQRIMNRAHAFWLFLEITHRSLVGSFPHVRGNQPCRRQLYTRAGER